MNVYSQIYTKATDFVGAIKGDVDPRTGQFTIKISLGSLMANNGLGPKIPLDLRYSPMTQANLGFGVGFGFGFTTYDQRSTLLSLGGGSTYKVLESDETLSLIDAKLRQVSVSKIPQHYYKTLYKDGSFELLTAPEVLSSLKVPDTIVSASGHFVTLNWAFADNQFRLVSIVDENGSTLVSVDYPDEQNLATRIAVLPDRQIATAGSDDPEGYNVYLFFGDSHHLTRITCDAADDLEWNIGYTNLNSIGPWGQVASSITYPGGLYEYVKYSRSRGHRFSSARPDMSSSLYPYVREFTRVPGDSQPMITTTYDYEVINSHNFLGHAAPGIYARNPTLDALYNCADSTYRYHTLETHVDDNGEETRIGRTYNCFHQLVEQKSTTSDCSVTRRTKYGSLPGSGFEAQPANFQCPKTKTIIWSRTDPVTGAVVSTSEAAQNFTYDNYGNILERSGTYTDAAGTETAIGTLTYEYYPAETGTSYDPNTGFGCPADPNSYNKGNKIPRFVKSKTFTPHQFHGDEQPKEIRYAYTQYDLPDAVKQLLSSTDPDYNSAYAVLKSEQRIYDNGETLLEKTTYTYADKDAVLAGTDMREFGQLLQTIDTHYPNDGVVIDSTDPKTAASFETTTNTQIELVNSNNDLKTTTTVTTWDSLSTSSSQTSSRFTGRIKERVDEVGIVIQATYDALGRVVSETTAVGTDYEDEYTLSYVFGTAATTSYLITATDRLGNQAKTTFDGLGRALTGTVKLGTAGAIWQTMQSRQYDCSGRLSASTSYDYKDETKADIIGAYSTVTSTRHYDNWGRVDYVTDAEGIRRYNSIDPIALTKTAYSQSADASAETARTVLSANVATCSASIELFNSTTAPSNSGGLYSTVTQNYDGWKQLRKTTDELARDTTFDYDVFGRVTTTTLPIVPNQKGDGSTVVTRLYSRDSASSTVTDIQVNGTSMGTREVDSLGRVTKQTVGGRVTTAIYDAASGSLTAPFQVTTPYGTTVQFLYEAALGGKIASKSLMVGGKATDTAVFSYSKKTDQTQVGRLLNTVSTVNALSNTITNSYDLAGRLLTETFNDGSTASHKHTVAGKAWSYTDITSQTWEVTEADVYGRPTTVNDGGYVRLSLSYDNLGRTQSWTTTDSLSAETLITSLIWDGVDREFTRTMDSSRTGQRMLVQQDYSKNHQISRRTLKRGSVSTPPENLTTTRIENYAYDKRNRLSSYNVQNPTDLDWIRDDKNNIITGEAYGSAGDPGYDAFNNILKVTTTFKNGQDIATFTYDTTDITQLVTINHSNITLGSQIDLTYDGYGCLQSDENGSVMSYDQGINCGYICGFQTQGSTDVPKTFQYDALRRVVNESGTTLFYNGTTLAAQRQGNNTNRLVYGPSGAIGQVDNANTVWLNGAGLDGSILSADSPDGAQQHYDVAYGPYGQQTTQEGQSPVILGYNGERKSNLLGGYQLGNGYRLYKPSLRRFTSPDTLSPFGAGGINPYAYCEGDPINNTDPTGH
ncbi:RHS repeat-associated core domain-containing protein [Brucella sp. LJL56]